MGKRAKRGGDPAGGRITAVADVFAALTSRRPYKEPFSVGKSFGIIKEGRDQHFEPAVVGVFLADLDEALKIKSNYSA